MERQQIHINKPDFRKRATFADLAQHYQQHELGERGSAIVDPKAHTTIAGYKRIGTAVFSGWIDFARERTP